MTSTRLRNSLTAALAFTVAATLIAGSAFAADGGNGKFKRRGNSGQFNTGTFQIVVPKADRGGSGRQVAKFVAPEGRPGHRRQSGHHHHAAQGQTRTTAQFVAPKADRGKTGGPTTLFSLSPKAPRAGNGPTAAAVRGAEGPARRWTDRCHGRAAEVCRPATARARIRPDARQGRAGHFCSGSRRDQGCASRGGERDPRTGSGRDRGQRRRSRACLHPRRPALRLWRLCRRLRDLRSRVTTIPIPAAPTETTAATDVSSLS